MIFFLLCLGAYALGSIPFALLFTRNIVDIRTQGSGNIGATNVLRSVGKKRAAATLFCDMAKGAIPTLIALYVLSFTEIEAAAVGTFAIIGHILPVWLKGKGGKAVATTLGVYFGLHYALALSVIAVWLATVRITGISSLGALAAVTAAPLIGWFLGMDLYLIAWLVGVWAAIIITHRENIQRLIKGEEKAFKAKK